MVSGRTVRHTFYLIIVCFGCISLFLHVLKLRIPHSGDFRIAPSMVLGTDNKLKYDAVSVNGVNNSENNETFLLFWNPPKWLRNVYPAAGHRECPTSKKCTLTYDRSAFNKSKVVIFSAGFAAGVELPPVKPSERNPNQIWTIFTMEPPMLLWPWYKRKEWQNVFNWSWTYRLDSDIHIPYGVLLRKKDPDPRNFSSIFRQKSKMAAWIVSHCKTQSLRNIFFDILKTYVQADKFGMCSSRGRLKTEKIGDVYKRYKFILGLESAFCKDYVTEKFFRTFNKDIITVVRGSYDYNKYFPKGTFINAADFSSIKTLADYLNKLGQNENEYVKYLQEKNKYHAYGIDFTLSQSLCDICKKLSLPMKSQTYENIVEWIGKCQPVKDLV